MIYVMRLKIRGVLSLVFMTLSIFMMLDIKYTRALGDYVLEYIGLMPWTEGDQGFHLTIIYFGTLFLIGLFMVKDNVVIKMKKKKMFVFICSILLLVFYYVSVSSIFNLIKSNSEGLLVIGLEKSDEHQTYIKVSQDDNGMQKFESKFTLKNYSNEVKYFNIKLLNDCLESEALTIYNKNGEMALFKIRPNKNKEFILSSEDYNININSINNNTLFEGCIDLILFNNEFNYMVYLERGKFLGTKVAK